jgi:diguanylate cyclase (GGDEF)-like protein
MRWLGLTIAATALAPLPFTWLGPDVAVPPAARALAAMAGALVTAFVAATLACERSERQLRDTHRRLRTLANIDTLTNVPNRRHFHELATQALRADEPSSATLLMFDIDEFKLINDHFGHAAGDRALCLVSGSLREHLRAHDIAGRHGGDEFAALLRGTRVADAMTIAGRIVAALQRQAEAVALPPFSLSFGVVQMLPAETIDDALRRADLALYEAKRQGRSRAVSAEGDEERPVFGESRRLGLLAA